MVSGWNKGLTKLQWKTIRGEVKNKAHKERLKRGQQRRKIMEKQTIYLD